VDLEVEVHGRRARLAGVAHERDHLARPHLAAVDGERRVRGEVRVVELVAGPVSEPEAEAADLVPADGEDRPVRDREHRLAELAEDVLAVVPARAGPGGPEGVAEADRAVDREDVAAGRQLRVHAGGQRAEDRWAGSAVGAAIAAGVGLQRRGARP
jgi:hypothetical protein